MAIEQWKLCCENQIRANFQMRNAPAHANASRQKRMKRDRRAQIRKVICLLRQARDPKLAALVGEAVKWKVA